MKRNLTLYLFFFILKLPSSFKNILQGIVFLNLLNDQAPLTNILHGHEFDCVPFQPSFFWTENFSSGLTILFLWSVPLSFQASLTVLWPWWNVLNRTMISTPSSETLFILFKDLTKLYNPVFLINFFQCYLCHLVDLLSCHSIPDYLQEIVDTDSDIKFLPGQK